VAKMKGNNLRPPFYTKSLEKLSKLNRKFSVSAWDEGIAVINFILKPGSSTNDTLSDSQKEALAKVKDILLEGSEDQTKHIPADLFANHKRTKHIGNEKTSICPTNSYLLNQFAGVNTESPRKKWKRAINVLRFINRMKIEGRKRTIYRRPSHGSGSFILPEWTMLAPDIQARVARLLSWDSLSKWDFDIFEMEKLTDGKALLFVGWALLSSPHAQYAMAKQLLAQGESNLSLPLFDNMEGYGFIEVFDIPQMTLCNFLRVIMGDYNNEIFYHNSTHAADVLQSVHSIITKIDRNQYIVADLEIFSVLLAAAIHDVGHQGRNNNFHVNKRTKLALRYNDTSVLENMHVASAFSRIMGDDRDSNLDIFEYMQPEQVTACRRQIIGAVLHTDMSKHFSDISKMKGLLMKKEHRDSDAIYGGWEVFPFFLHMADISNQAKHSPIAKQWTDRCLKEFFEQGDEEKKLGLPVSPLCCRLKTDTAESQVGFITYVVQPAYEVLGMMVPRVKEEINPNIEFNLSYWEEVQSKNEKN